MVEQTRVWASLVAVLLLAPLAGCGGDDDDDERDKRPRPVAGNFVGEIRGTNAFVAVMTPPPRRGGDRRAVNVYVSDGRRLSERFRGTLTSNSFTTKSDDGDAEAKGELRRDGVTGTIKLPGRRETARYQAERATGGSGLYNLTVSSGGKLRGTSAAGLLLKGDSTLPRPGRGRLKLVDGRSLRFVATRRTGGDPIQIQPGIVRLIVLPNGRLRGAGTPRRGRGGGGSGFFIRSAK